MKLIYSRSASDDLDKLNPKIALRILDKIEWFINSPNPLAFAKRLNGMLPATHRFRVGNYRILVEIVMEEVYEKG